jgi:hypothetical protein
MKNAFRILVALTVGFVSMPGFAQGQFSGFMEDYDQLQPSEDVWIDYIYTNPNWPSKLAGTTAFMLEQPEIFISADSKYKGMKPDDMKMLADSLQAIFAENLVGEFQIAASPGPNTLVLRMALTNVHLKKKGRGLLGYTPVGFVAGGANRALMNDFVDNILLTEVMWEAVIYDSQTGDRYGALIVSLGNRDQKREYTSWDELMQALEVGSERIVCRIDNAKKVDGEQRDCLAEITGM